MLTFLWIYAAGIGLAALAVTLWDSEASSFVDAIMCALWPLMLACCAYALALAIIDSARAEEVQ